MPTLVLPSKILKNISSGSFWNRPQNTRTFIIGTYWKLQIVALRRRYLKYHNRHFPQIVKCVLLY